jgi:hypothetical protein
MRSKRWKVDERGRKGGGAGLVKLVKGKNHEAKPLANLFLLFAYTFP